MRVSSMIAANALLSKHPWTRLKPSLSKSVFSKELLRREDTPEDVREAIQAPDSSYDSAVLTTSRWINSYFQSQQTQLTSEAVYTKEALQTYDRLVWDFNSPFLWRIHMEEVKELYNQCLLQSTHHAEVAVGTGLFLRELNFPESLLDITLIDLNANTIESCLNSLPNDPHYEYSRVQFSGVLCDILEPPPMELQNKFDSVAANFLLHCLHGGVETSRIAMENMAKMLNPKTGVFFGTTILGQAILQDAENAGTAALETLKLYNDIGIFGNMEHNYGDLSRILHDTFDDVEIWRVGYCAGWVARQRKQS